MSYVAKFLEVTVISKEIWCIFDDFEDSGALSGINRTSNRRSSKILYLACKFQQRYAPRTRVVRYEFFCSDWKLSRKQREYVEAHLKSSKHAQLIKRSVTVEN